MASWQCERENEVKYGLSLPNVRNYGDARLLAELAAEAEGAGWDGFFVWDTFQMPEADGYPVADVWVALAAIAMRTERIRIGPRVVVPPRVRPWLLARQAVTLDHLSGGRLILGVGSGDASDRGFTAFGEELDARTRADRLDEGLSILEGLWSGETFAFAGQHYRFDAVRLLPRPVQRPRIPIWVAGTWPKRRPMERAARWDGVNPFTLDEHGTYSNLGPDEIDGLRRFGAERRVDGVTWDIVVDAPVFAAARDGVALGQLRAMAMAGATWALENPSPDHDVDMVRAAIRSGPPVLAGVMTPETAGAAVGPGSARPVE